MNELDPDKIDKLLDEIFDSEFYEDNIVDDKYVDDGTEEYYMVDDTEPNLKFVGNPSFSLDSQNDVSDGEA